MCYVVLKVCAHTFVQKKTNKKKPSAIERKLTVCVCVARCVGTYRQTNTETKTYLILCVAALFYGAERLLNKTSVQTLRKVKSSAHELRIKIKASSV